MDNRTKGQRTEGLKDKKKKAEVLKSKSAITKVKEDKRQKGIREKREKGKESKGKKVIRAKKKNGKRAKE